MFENERAAYFPLELIPGIFARPETDRTAFFNIVSPLMNHIFTPLGALGAFVRPEERWNNLKLLRDVFAHTHQEQFVFTNTQHEPVGWSYGEMLDYETFFMTNTGILPDYQRSGIYTAFLKQLLSYLATLGYERVTSKHQTNNTPVIIAKLKMGFIILGVDLDERWGAQVELGYYFHEDRRRGYEQAFALQNRDTPIRH